MTFRQKKALRKAVNQLGAILGQIRGDPGIPFETAWAVLDELRARVETKYAHDTGLETEHARPSDTQRSV